MHIDNRKNQWLPPQPNNVYYTHAKQHKPSIIPELSSPRTGSTSQRDRSRDSLRKNSFQDIFRHNGVQIKSRSKSRQKVTVRKIRTEESPLRRMLCQKAIQFYQDQISNRLPLSNMSKRKKDRGKQMKIQIQNSNTNSDQILREGNIFSEYGLNNQINSQISLHKPKVFEQFQKTQSHHFTTETNFDTIHRHSNNSHNSQIYLEANNYFQSIRQEKQISNSMGYSCELKLRSNFSLSDRRSSLSKSSESISIKLRSIKNSISNPMMTQTLEKIQIHLTSINYLARYSDWMEQFYKDDAQWEVAKCLVYRRFYQERERVHQSLMGYDNCFHLKDLEVGELQLKMLMSNYTQLKDFCLTIQKQNESVRECLRKIQSDLALKNIYIADTSHLYLYNEVNREFRVLGDLLDRGVSLQQQEIYKQRMVSIMQIVFLIEELEGRYVRGFLQAEQMDFREYINEAYLDYNRIVTNRK